ncbi:MAG: glutathione S-transferase family protein [Halomonadaceae bacterium]|uniref:Glutathione S-transferase N-terminal domain-containing protein n=1 Tax=Halomonas colorata TaxID=2742615 RepID=A0ABR9FYX0_9GAMM|nr:glutathione S-transferase N-terminal domain-containing protein [Halomonas colorata]MBE0463858.1 glutathione S-transferase N-terminal domain-containing protein [Halomonas colorata]
MQLYLNTTSPYARLVRIVLIEKGLINAVTLNWCDPWADDPALLKANPAGRIPALVTEKGTTLSESMLIAIYLDSAYPEKPVLPVNCMGEVLHLAGLGQNLMEAAFTTVIARKHNGNEADNSVLGARRLRAIQRLLNQLNSELGEASVDAINLGEIAVAVALDYLAFRLPKLAWRADYPQLQAWQAGVISRVSFQQTAFV